MIHPSRLGPDGTPTAETTLAQFPDIAFRMQDARERLGYLFSKV